MCFVIDVCVLMVCVAIEVFMKVCWDVCDVLLMLYVGFEIVLSV